MYHTDFLSVISSQAQWAETELRASSRNLAELLSFILNVNSPVLSPPACPRDDVLILKSEETFSHPLNSFLFPPLSESVYMKPKPQMGLL